MAKKKPGKNKGLSIGVAPTFMYRTGKALFPVKRLSVREYREAKEHEARLAEEVANRVRQEGGPVCIFGLGPLGSGQKLEFPKF